MDEESFANLPADILRHLATTYRYVSKMMIMASKDLRQIFLPIFYDIYHSNLISEQELLSYLDREGSNSVIVINRERCNTGSYLIIICSCSACPSNRSEPYCDVEIQHTTGLHIVYDDSGREVGVEADWICADGPESIDRSENLPLDMFSTYRIHANRLSLLAYNPRYAKDILLDTYNREIVPPLNNPLTVSPDEEDDDNYPSDMERIFIAYCTLEIPSRFSTICKMCVDNREEISKFFEDLQEQIKQKVVQLTA